MPLLGIPERHRHRAELDPHAVDVVELAEQRRDRGRRTLVIAREAPALARRNGTGREPDLVRCAPGLDDDELFERVAECALVRGDDRIRDRRIGHGGGRVGGERVGVDLDLEVRRSPAVVQANPGRELFLGPAVAGYDEPRQARIVLDRPGTFGEEATELGASAIDQGDRHPSERRPGDAFDGGSRPPRTGNPQAGRISIMGQPGIVRSLRPGLSDRPSTLSAPNSDL